MPRWIGRSWIAPDLSSVGGGLRGCGCPHSLEEVWIYYGSTSFSHSNSLGTPGVMELSSLRDGALSGDTSFYVNG